MAGGLLAASTAFADPAPSGMVTLTPNTSGAPSQLALDAEGPGAGLSGEVPTGLALSLQNGFTVNPAAIAGVCSNQDAANNACPASSKFASGTINVAITGLLNQTTTANVSLYIAPPQATGDPAGAAFSFSVTSPSNFSGTALGRIENLNDPVYGTEIIFSQLPIPPIPPVIHITLQNFKLTSISPNGTITPTPTPTPTPKAKAKKKKHHKKKRHHTKKHTKKKTTAKAHKAAASFLTNPTSCTGSWAVRLQVFYSSGTQERVASVPCSS